MTTNETIDPIEVPSTGTSTAETVAVAEVSAPEERPIFDETIAGEVELDQLADLLGVLPGGAGVQVTARSGRTFSFARILLAAVTRIEAAAAVTGAGAIK